MSLFDGTKRNIYYTSVITLRNSYRFHFASTQIVIPTYHDEQDVIIYRVEIKPTIDLSFAINL